MNLPLVTIGITCFNAQETIAQAIDGALAQDYPNKEILIVDDCSKDNSVTVIGKKITGLNNVRLVVHEKNKGFAGALNTIIAESGGEFLAIFDDDDVSLPQRVSRQYERITGYEKQFGTKMIVCHAARIQKFPNGFERYEPTMGTETGQAPQGYNVTDRILTGRLSRGVVGSCANCSRMARLEVFRKMGGFDATLRRNEDTDFNIRFGLAGGHFVGIAEPLVIQTMTTGKEKTLAAEQAAELAVLEKHRDYLEQKGWYGFCRRWLDARYAHLNNQKKTMLNIILWLALHHPMKVLSKLMWIIPAHATRRDFKKWHQGAMS